MSSQILIISVGPEAPHHHSFASAKEKANKPVYFRLILNGESNYTGVCVLFLAVTAWIKRHRENAGRHQMVERVCDQLFLLSWPPCRLSQVESLNNRTLVPKDTRTRHQ